MVCYATRSLCPVSVRSDGIPYMFGLYISQVYSLTADLSCHPDRSAIQLGDAGAWDANLHKLPVPLAHHSSLCACREPDWMLPQLV